MNVHSCQIFPNSWLNVPRFVSSIGSCSCSISNIACPNISSSNKLLNIYSFIVRLFSFQNKISCSRLFHLYLWRKLNYLTVIWYYGINNWFIFHLYIVGLGYYYVTAMRNHKFVLVNFNGGWIFYNFNVRGVGSIFSLNTYFKVNVSVSISRILKILLVSVIRRYCSYGGRSQ